MNTLEVNKKYNFEEIKNCEMCGMSVLEHKVLGQRLDQSQGFHPKKKSGISVSVKKCTNCGLIYSSPMAIPVDIQDHYGIVPEEYWHAASLETGAGYFIDEIKTAKELLSFQRGMKALDIGAGLGKAMRAMTDAGFEAHGIEPSKPFYERAIKKMNIAPEKIKCSMIEDAEYPANTFDLVTFGAVFEHLYHPAAVLAKTLTWLKPGGIVHIEVPSSNYLISKLINSYYRIMGTNYVTHLSPMHVPFHLYEFDLRSFEALSKKLKFRIEKTEFHVCPIPLFPKFTHSLLSACMNLTDSGMQLTVWLRKQA